MARKIRRCANCQKKLTRAEIAADWNDEWWACMPCWDKSAGFLGWPTNLRPTIVQRKYVDAGPSLADLDAAEQVDPYWGHGEEDY